MDVRVRGFTVSARRHGISESRILEAIADCVGPYDIAAEATGEANMVLILGHDRNGAALEVVAHELKDGSLIVFHAMARRPAYRELHRDLEDRR